METSIQITISPSDRSVGHPTPQDRLPTADKFSHPVNIRDLRPPISVGISVRDIERIPEASILTNRPPYCYASCLAVTERSMPESSIGLRSWQALFGILRVNCSRIYSSITFP